MVLAVQTTKSMEVLSNPMFCGDSGKRTIFNIQLTQGQVRQEGGLNDLELTQSGDGNRAVVVRQTTGAAASLTPSSGCQQSKRHGGGAIRSCLDRKCCPSPTMRTPVN